jgi:hypothetical protein
MFWCTQESITGSEFKNLKGIKKLHMVGCREELIFKAIDEGILKTS